MGWPGKQGRAGPLGGAQTSLRRKGDPDCSGKLIWCVKWCFRRNLKATGLQQEPRRDMGVGEPPFKGSEWVPLSCETLKTRTCLPHAQGLPRTQPGSEALSDLKNPARGNPGPPAGGAELRPFAHWACAGAGRPGRLRERDEPGSACACPSAREVVLFRVFPAVAVRREPGRSRRHPPAPQRCPATASLSTSTPGEGRPRSWARRRPQPLPPPVPSASLAAI